MTENPVAFVSPRDGFAALLADDQDKVGLVAPPSQEGRKIPVCNYISRFPDTTAVQVADAQEALKHLSEHQDRSLAFDFALLLFDGEVSTETRSKIAHELEDLLEVEDCREYVLDIILAHPLPDGVDSMGAERIAKPFDNVRSFVHAVLESQTRVAAAYAASLEMHDDHMVKRAGALDIYGALIRFGVFRRLVLEGTTRALVESIKARIVMDNALGRCCDPRIMTAMVARYSSSLPSGLRVERPVVATAQTQPGLQETSKARDHLNSRPRVSADVQRARAESQVSRIADLFGQGNDSTAQRFLKELIESQSADRTDHPHLVKSLCNIATRTLVRGRRDVAIQCLDEALNYREGYDARLYIQIGNLLRTVNQCDRALACYDKAADLDRGEMRDAICLETIRTLVAKGEYGDAEQRYLQMPELQHQPDALCSLGTLYRRMGNVRDARRQYGRVLELDPASHTARAGLAEANKQTGRHDKAIKRYNAILDAYPNLDEGNAKIYTSALAFLYRLTHRYEKARSLLTELHAEYPKDSEVHLQLAKLYVLTGDRDRAEEHVHQARGPAIDTLAARLYFAAIGEPTPNSKRTQIASAEIDLPENQGLVYCERALRAIENRSYERAKALAQKARYVDRLHADFGAVLAYHAEKNLEPGFNYKSSHVICRIAKRGYAELQQSVRAIAANDFASAEASERRFCLLVA